MGEGNGGSAVTLEKTGENEMYDILYLRRPVDVDVGSDIDEIPDDAAEYLAQRRAEEEKKTES